MFQINRTLVVIAFVHHISCYTDEQLFQFIQANKYVIN